MPLTHATAEYLFNQAQIAEAFHVEGFDAGACLGIVLRWLAEKKNTSNGLGASLSRLMGGGETRTFYGRKSLALQLPVLQGAMDLHTNYAASIMAGEIDSQATREAIVTVGLTVDESLSDWANTVEGAQRMVRGPANVPVADIYDSLTIASGLSLAKGSGMIVSVMVGSGKHVVGIYRSRGSNIHFFDPNIGVFKVDGLVGFLMSWVDYYEQKGVSLELDTRTETFLYVS